MLSLMTFEPILKSVIWGGEKIAGFKGVVTDQEKIGESWEISGVPGHESVIANGPLKGQTLGRVLADNKEALVGKQTYEFYGDTFPLLIKLIDAAQDLSVQVHPDDALARVRHNSLGKTEMWYIIATDPGANINAGFSAALTPDEYAARVADNTIMDVIAHHESHPGDVFFLPAGRVHSIGGGNLLIEVQETSDITYRIYDFDRRDAQGNPRQLHVEESKDAINYEVLPDYRTTPVALGDNTEDLVRCNHFDVRRIVVDGSHELDLSTFDAFLTITTIDGEVEVTDNLGTTVTLPRGNSLLVPATATGVTLRGRGTVVTSSTESL
ncbi:MAG: class I mannose-6-phosphate isomerase [Clostridium sp.]|nr:class I mannose-6-phosphate isomerase [Clostridium sp.]